MSSDIKCFVCSKDDTPLYRQNEFGVKGIWACREHSTVKIDNDVKELTEIIHRGNK